MIAELMEYTGSYFPVFKEYDTFIITNSTIQVNGKYKAGQYIRIMYSDLNDGIHKIASVDGQVLTITGLQTEIFNGYVVALAPPNSFINLADEIKSFASSNPMSGLSSESIPNYSYSVAKGKDGMQGWESVFSNRIAKYVNFKVQDGVWLGRICDYGS